jgi:predicted house-cleaning noncanonical NTP pyrophosphatase (MazG superfamily)
MSPLETREFTVVTTVDIPDHIQVEKHDDLRQKKIHINPALEFWKKHSQALGFIPNFDLTIDGDREIADITVLWGDPSNPTKRFNTGNEYIDNPDNNTDILGVIEASTNAPNDEFIRMYNYQNYHSDTIDEALTHCLGRALGVSFDSSLSIMRPRYAVFPSIAKQALSNVKVTQDNLTRVLDALGPYPDETLERGEYGRIIDNIDGAREIVLAAQTLYAEKRGIIYRTGTKKALANLGYFLLLFDELIDILNYLAEQASKEIPVYDPSFSELTPRESLDRIRKTELGMMFQREFYRAWVKNQYANNQHVYGKLVRDRIPKIIEENGEYPITQRLTGERYRNALIEKVTEELDEYREDSGASELGDLLEVIHALCEYESMSEHELNKLRTEKAEELAGGRGRDALIEKVTETLDQYREDHDERGLGNLLGVIHALREYEGMSEHELNKLRTKKADERGRFDDGVFLDSVID